MIYVYRFDPQTDVLVEWDDGTRNVVMVRDLIFHKTLRKGCQVEMQWGQGRWSGRVVDVENYSDSEDSSDSESGIPLARLTQKAEQNPRYEYSIILFKNILRPIFKQHTNLSDHN